MAGSFFTNTPDTLYSNFFSSKRGLRFPFEFQIEYFLLPSSAHSICASPEVWCPAMETLIREFLFDAP